MEALPSGVTDETSLATAQAKPLGGWRGYRLCHLPSSTCYNLALFGCPSLQELNRPREKGNLIRQGLRARSLPPYFRGAALLLSA